MFPGYCGVTGLTGWPVMLLVWAALLVMVVWGIRWLFPDRPPPADPAVRIAKAKTHRMFRSSHAGIEAGAQDYGRLSCTARR